MQSLPLDYRAIVFGCTGGLGNEFVRQLLADERCSEVIGLSRNSSPAIDFDDVASVERAAQTLSQGGDVHLLIDATGLLHENSLKPEKSLKEIDADALHRSFLINAIGPAHLLKHFHHLMPSNERSYFVSLSARVGSIGDNGLGGWYGYRASKAALNMLMKTASIEIARRRPDSICLALHPGTVETTLSDPYAGRRDRMSPEQSVGLMLNAIDGTGPKQTGSFIAYDGEPIVW